MLKHPDIGHHWPVVQINHLRAALEWNHGIGLDGHSIVQ